MLHLVPSSAIVDACSSERPGCATHWEPTLHHNVKPRRDRPEAAGRYLCAAYIVAELSVSFSYAFATILSSTTWKETGWDERRERGRPRWRTWR
jgi:hypothetical protein